MAGGILEARLTYDFLNNERLTCGVIHSKFNSAINIFFSEGKLFDASSRLITIVRKGSKGIPDSLTTVDDEFDRLLKLTQTGDLVYKKTEPECFCFIFADLTSAAGRSYGAASALKGEYGVIRTSRIPVCYCAGSCQSKAGLKLFLEEYGRFRDKDGFRDGFSDLSQAVKAGIEKHLERFCISLILSDIEGARSSAYSIAGTGRGLTPAADDALIGVMAAYTGAVSCGEEGRTEGRENHKNAGPAKCLTDVVCDITRLDDLLSGRTTDISMKYLCCAQEGRFSDTVAELVKILFTCDGDELQTSLLLRNKMASVAAYGATSGADTLAGIAAAARIMIKFDHGR